MNDIENLQNQIEGATILSSEIDTDDMTKLYLSNGLVLFVVGTFGLGLARYQEDKLH